MSGEACDLCHKVSPHQERSFGRSKGCADGSSLRKKGAGAGERERERERELSATNFIPEAFRSNNSDFIADTLIRLEIEGEFGVIAFDDDL